jgi:hypothetical protein
VSNEASPYKWLYRVWDITRPIQSLAIARVLGDRSRRCFVA